MLTIFAIPKPFEGQIGLIQRNAIQSWMLLRPKCQVILCGDERGTGEAAAEFGAEWIPVVVRNEFGTPLLSSVFEVTERRAAHRLLCYVNADIILLPDFIDAVRVVDAAKRLFLMVGQRWDLDVSDGLLLDRDGWEPSLRSRVKREGSLHPPWGSDYFVYPLGTIGPLPPFAVGRPGWDNWMIYRARSRRVAVVDATQSASVIHQNHSYGHVAGSTGETYDGPEGRRNSALIGTKRRLFTLAQATHRLTSAGLVSTHRWTVADLTQRLLDEAVIAPRLLERPTLAVRTAWSARRTG